MKWFERSERSRRKTGDSFSWSLLSGLRNGYKCRILRLGGREGGASAEPILCLFPFNS